MNNEITQCYIPKSRNKENIFKLYYFGIIYGLVKLCIYLQNDFLLTQYFYDK